MFSCCVTSFPLKAGTARYLRLGRHGRNSHSYILMTTHSPLQVSASVVQQRFFELWAIPCCSARTELRCASSLCPGREKETKSSRTRCISLVRDISVVRSCLHIFAASHMKCVASFFGVRIGCVILAHSHGFWRTIASLPHSHALYQPPHPARIQALSNTTVRRL